MVTIEVTKHHGSEFWMDKHGNLVMILQKAQQFGSLVIILFTMVILCKCNDV